MALSGQLCAVLGNFVRTFRGVFSRCSKSLTEFSSEYGTTICWAKGSTAEAGLGSKIILLGRIDFW